jgi:hypothetical protein
MNQPRRVSISKLSFVLIAFLMLGTVSTVAEEHAVTKQMEEPKYNGFTWGYHGIAEYGHEMKISSIIKTNNEVYYAIDGKVYVASGGESLITRF